MQTARANVIADLTSLNKLPSTKVFVAAENGSVEVLGLVALFWKETIEVIVIANAGSDILREAPCYTQRLLVIMREW